MNRIEQIKNLIFKKYNTLIDIGSDHGYLGLKTLSEKKVNSVWNVELSSISLNQSKNTYKKNGFDKQTCFFISDGFDKLPKIPRNSILVISGLGSKKIVEILMRGNLSNIKKIILLPHSNPIQIREWAFNNNWKIQIEKYFEDKKIVYWIISLTKNLFKPKIKNIEIIYGNKKFMNENIILWKKYWSQMIFKIQQKQSIYQKDWEKKFLSFWEQK